MSLHFVSVFPILKRAISSDVMENKDKSKQNEHDSGMFQVKEISKTNKNDGINLVLPVSINGRKIDGLLIADKSAAVLLL
jgi:phage antirepressor YoqD-like protein